MRIRATALALTLIAGLLTGCVEDLPRPSLVDDVRILAVASDPAEAEPGDTVTLTALVVDPENRARTLRWATCLVPEQGFGFFGGSSETSSSGGNGYGLDDPGSCFDLAEAGDPWAYELGEGESITLDVPADLFDTDAALKVAYGLPDEIELASELQTLFLGISGVNLTVSLRVEVDGRTFEATKRVNVGVPSLLPDNPRNANPGDATYHVAREIDEVEPPMTGEAPADGSCFTGHVADDLVLKRGVRYVMTPQNIPAPQPTYAALLPGTSTDEPFQVVYQEENWYFAWFATQKGLEKDASKGSAVPENTFFVAEDAPDSGQLWVVVRDGRGGTTWCASQFSVEDQ